MKLLLLDNYDSFTYNLFDYFARLGVLATVRRNDEITVDEINHFDRIVLSPGPGLPREAGILMDVIHAFHRTKPMLGVCLGHQAISEYFGGQLHNLEHVWHGRQSLTQKVGNDPLFDGICEEFVTGHYHSWVVDGAHVGQGIEVIARNEFGWVMATRHHKFPLRGVQFHPESIMTPDGLRILANWLAMKFV